MLLCKQLGKKDSEQNANSLPWPISTQPEAANSPCTETKNSYKKLMSPA